MEHYSKTGDLRDKTGMDCKSANETELKKH